jgi:hypothetical protein
METEGGSPLPRIFQSIAGGVFPLYHVLADAAEFSEAGSAGGQVLPGRSTDRLRVNGLALRKGGAVCVLLANFTGQAQRVSVTGVGNPTRAVLRALDERSAEFAMRQPEDYRLQAGEAIPAAGRELRLALRPYAVARVDIEYNIR